MEEPKAIVAGMFKEPISQKESSLWQVFLVKSQLAGALASGTFEFMLMMPVPNVLVSLYGQ